MTCGCNKFPDVVGEIQIRTGDIGDKMLVAQHPNPPTTMVIVLGVGKQHVEMIGKATGRSYGYVTNGVIFPMDVEDFAAERRVAKLNKETLRLVV